MDQVPKVLKPMVQQWVPEGFIVSFKLETDVNLLIPKASAALERYGHQVVVANDLHSRKEKVCFVSSNSPRTEAKWLILKDREREIEQDIVEELTRRHDRWIDEGRV